MAYSPKRLVLVGLGAAALTSGIVSAVSHPEFDSKKDKKLSGKVEGALKTLEAELQRRFHDRNNIDFGMSRVVREDGRMHAGPLSALRSKGNRSPTRKDAAGKWEIQNEFGEWTLIDKQVPRMHPENDVERTAIQTLLDSQTDVAIYTVGFAKDIKNQRPFGGTPFDPKTGARAKGPAYLSSRASTAPPATDMVDYARTALSEKGAPKPGAVKDGWRLYGIKVDADHESCLSCHTNMLGLGENQSPAYKIGETMGLIVIATRDSKPVQGKR